MKPLTVDDLMGDHNLDLVLGLENVMGLGIGSELEVEMLGQVIAVSLVALVPIRSPVGPVVVGLGIADLHADCLEEWNGEWWFRDPPSEAHDPILALLEAPERCCR